MELLYNTILKTSTDRYSPVLGVKVSENHWNNAKIPTLESKGFINPPSRSSREFCFSKFIQGLTAVDRGTKKYSVEKQVQCIFLKKKLVFIFNHCGGGTET